MLVKILTFGSEISLGVLPSRFVPTSHGDHFVVGECLMNSSKSRFISLAQLSSAHGERITDQLPKILGIIFFSHQHRVGHRCRVALIAQQIDTILDVLLPT